MKVLGFLGIVIAFFVSFILASTFFYQSQITPADPGKMTPAQIQAWAIRTGNRIFTCDNLILVTINSIQKAQNRKGKLSPLYEQELQHACTNSLGVFPTNSQNPYAVRGLLKDWQYINAQVKVIQLFYSTPISGWNKLGIRLDKAYPLGG